MPSGPSVRRAAHRRGPAACSKRTCPEELAGGLPPRPLGVQRLMRPPSVYASPQSLDASEPTKPRGQPQRPSPGPPVPLAPSRIPWRLSARPPFLLPSLYWEEEPRWSRSSCRTASRTPKRQTWSNKLERASPAMSCCLEQDPPLSLSTVYHKSTQTCYDRIVLELHVSGPRQ